MSKCICGGNWRALIEENDHLFDTRYKYTDGTRYLFRGILWASSDFYYEMFNPLTGTSKLLSCVGNIEGHGYVQVH